MRTGHEGIYRGHHIIYCFTVWYQPVFPIWLNNWQNRSVAQRLEGYQMVMP